MALALRTKDPFRAVHVGALALCAVFLPWSEALLSMAQMVLVVNWLAEGISRGTLKARFRTAFTEPPSVVFLSFFGIHLLGLVHTTDLDWGLDLVRILLPVLSFGVVLATSPRLTGAEYRSILLLSAWAAVTCFLFGVLFSKGAPGDYRALSVFISHIRLALLLCLAVVVFLTFKGSRPWVTVCHWIAALWAIYAINALGSIQGLVILALIAWIMAFRRTRRMTTGMRWSFRLLLIFIPFTALGDLVHLAGSSQRPIPPGLGQRSEWTARGSTYAHDTTNLQTENGNHVWTYIAWDELRSAWKQRTGRSLDGMDDRGHVLWSTAIRYMSSKGLLKDSVGVMALTDADIAAIQKGATNIDHGTQSRIRQRFDEVLFELDLYRTKGIVSGHSVTMRLEFLKAGWAIAKEHWLVGVGTGDTQVAFDVQYEEMDSPLEGRWRLRAHNEYLTLWISFGVLGLCWSLFTWWWPAYRMGAWQRPLFIAWAVAFGVSCLTDDTIETQPGATFFALYYALFVFGSPVRRGKDRALDG